jgi:lipopolysaccharide/colanic/teichoic acid biosynthesis glycosyltransferase
LYNQIGKRFFDLIMALIFMLLLLIPGALIWLVSIYDTGWPGIISQKRIGLYGRQFKIFKFKTMSGPVTNGEIGISSKNNISTIGRWLRNHHLDELPQLLNVLFGKMSLVGPRPWQKCEFTCIPQSKRNIRNLTKPGMTGPVQIYQTYNNSLDKTSAIQYDLAYARQITLLVDLYIMAITTIIVIKGRHRPL